MILYRILISLFSLAILAQVAIRRDWRLMRARLGYGPHVDGPCIWIHAASNGELTSAKPVVDSLHRMRPDLHIVITANSKSGVDLAQSWGYDARPAPLDMAWVTARMITNCSVVAHISLEKEIWPFRIKLCPGPVIVLGGAMSQKTATTWGRFPAIGSAVFPIIRGLSAQSQSARDRYRFLGLRDEAILPDLDLKSLYTAPDQPVDPVLLDQFDRRTTWLAASTHKGEEETILEAHKRALKTCPDLRLILVPRHPKRGDEIADLIDAAGFDYSRRSLGETGDAPVYLADTMGEMPIWYRLAGRVFIGGTLTDRGGHTPYEPVRFDCALIYGPDMGNFETAAKKLAAAGIEPVADSTGITDALNALSTTDRQDRAAKTARDALHQDADLPSLMEQINALLPLPKRYGYDQRP